MGCAAAAWASMIVPTACGGPDGAGELQSLQPLERALCEKVRACGCGEAFAAAGVMPPLDCEGWSLADLRPGLDEGYYYAYGDDYDAYESLPTSIDEECVRRLAERIDGTDCDLFFAGAPQDCRDYCSIVIGPGLEGQRCFRQEHCGRGLRCHLGECTDPCAVQAPAEGDRCESFASDCGDQLVCAVDEGEQGFCVALPGVGAACPDGLCVAGASCGDDGVCFEPAADGEPCTGHRQCASRYCPAGHCESAPAPNQPCGTDGACAPGSECVTEGDRQVCRSSGSQECLALVDAVLQVADLYF